MLSPCTLVCTLDDTTGLCFGCGRTRDEIGGWSTYTDAERHGIMAVLPARMETLERKPRRETKRSRLIRERQSS
jgi:predicted Fe-S protein YdhL (DUF1289 family)